MVSLLNWGQSLPLSSGNTVTTLLSNKGVVYTHLYAHFKKITKKTNTIKTRNPILI